MNLLGWLTDCSLTMVSYEVWIKVMCHPTLRSGSQVYSPFLDYKSFYIVKLTTENRHHIKLAIVFSC